MTKINIQNLRNLTTGKLHTEVSCIYEDIERITGYAFFTHQLPNAVKALEPWLRKHYPAETLWDGAYNPNHLGEIDLVPMSTQERAEFDRRYRELPSLLLNVGKGRGQDA